MVLLILLLLIVIRKFFSICISIVFYAHPVTSLQWCGVFVVFIGLTLQTYSKMQGGPKPADADVKEGKAKKKNQEKKKQ
jgi:hypothetical protein